MGSVNVVVLGGRLGADPEERRSAAGKAVLKFRLCCNRWDAKTSAEVAEWYSVVVFDREAENSLKVLKKGAAVLVEGRLSQNEWTDKDGNKKTTYEIVAFRVNLVAFAKRASEEGDTLSPPRAPSPPESQPSNGSRGRGNVTRDFVDSIPF